MLTIASAMLTLLDSSTPEESRTFASGGASAPSVVRNKPSSPRASDSAGGLTSLMRPTCEVVSGPCPTGTIEIVPSAAIISDVCGGTLIGPPSPSTV